MSDRPLQMFTDEYLEACRSMTADQICRFIEDFRRMVFEAGAPSEVAPETPSESRERSARAPSWRGGSTSGRA